MSKEHPSICYPATKHTKKQQVAKVFILVKSVMLGRKQKVEDVMEKDLDKSFSYADNGKGFKQLYTFTLNGIAVNVWYASSKPVKLNSSCGTYS